MFSVPLMLVCLSVVIKPSSMFLVIFWTYGFSGNGCPLMLMLVVFLVCCFFFMIGAMRLSIISMSFSGSVLMLMWGMRCFSGSG